MTSRPHRHSLRLLTCPRLTHCLSIAVLLATVSPVIADTDTASVLKKLQRADAEHKTARRTAALKEASMDIAQQQVEKLQQQLEKAKAQVEADRKAFEQAGREIETRGKMLAELRESLKRHQRADKLVAELKTAQADLDKAIARKQEIVTDQQKATERMQQLQQSLVTMAKERADSEKSVQSRLQELKQAREQLEQAGQALAVAQQQWKAAKGELETPQQELDADSRQVATAVAALKKADASLAALNKTRQTIRSAAEAAGMDPATVTGELDQSIVGVEMLVAKARQAVEKAKQREQTARGAVTAAIKKAETAQASMAGRQTQQADISRAHFELQLAIADLQNNQRRLTKKETTAKAELDTLKQQEPSRAESLKQQQAEIVRLEQEVKTREAAAADGLKKAGRLVSYSQHIAPILAGRCVSCHDTKSSAGDLRLDSLAGLLHGGKSGPLLDPTGHQSSRLWQVVTSGAMPKDAEPLTADQQELLRRWLDDGAINDSGRDRTASVFDVVPEKPQPAAPVSYRVPLPVTSLAMHPDGSQLATAGQNELLIWNARDGRLQQRIGNVAELVSDLAFSADGKFLMAAASVPGVYGEVKMFSLDDGSPARTLLRRNDAILAVSLSPSGKELAVTTAAGEVSLVSPDTMHTRRLPPHADWVTDVNWSPDGAALVTACRDGIVRVFETASLTLISRNAAHTQPVYSAAFSRDGQQVVSVGSDQTARVFDAASGKVIRTIEGFDSDIFRVLVTSDNRVLTASADRMARSHSLADGSMLQDFSGHRDWVYAMDFHDAQKLLVTGSYDGQVRLWNAGDGSLLSEFYVQPQRVTQ
ncbi:MAG: hypothetical protein NXI04_17970 [Planctomycetaceae bacterium]|nr:hypothetical protein [Planctomycetaceae bacterium]